MEAMKFSRFLLFAIIGVVILQYVSACIDNTDRCQPDGSQGYCCSGYCHKLPGWRYGTCKPRPGRISRCISNGQNCQPDGSVGNCCSGFCYKLRGWNSGHCKRR